MTNYVYLIYKDFGRTDSGSFIKFATLDRGKAVDFLSRVREEEKAESLFPGKSEYYLRSVPLGEELLKKGKIAV